MTEIASNTSKPWRIEFLESPVDKTLIRFGTWAKDPEKVRIGLIFLNGRSEWIEKYDNLPIDLNLGDEVLWVTMDHRGQGASGGSRAHVDTYEDFARDTAAVAAAAFGPHLPYCILTHSMGGLIALTAVLKGLLHPQVMVLCSPLLAIPHEPLHRSIAKPLARLIAKSSWKKRATGAKTKREANFHSNTLTHSLQGFQRIVNSPFPYESPTFGWVHATFDACDRAFDPAALRGLHCPVKIIYGSQEKVVDPSVFALWCDLAQKAQTEPIEIIRIPDGRHELFNEIPRLRNKAITQARDWFLSFGPFLNTKS